MGPTLVPINDDAGPPAVLSQIERAGVSIVKLPSEHTPEAAEERIREINSPDIGSFGLGSAS